MKFKAEHFDLLGVLCFPFIFIYAVWALKAGQLPPDWMTKMLVVIGVGGFLIDGTIVYRFFFKKRG